jgi:single-strand DNA-binding protein
MSNDVNSLNITGRIGADPELKYTQGGEAVLNLRVAVGHRTKKGGEWVDEAIWLTVTIFGKRAEGFSKIARKGSRIGATGELRVRTYETRDGGKGTSVELYAFNVVPLDGRPQDGGERSQQSSGQRSQSGGSSSSQRGNSPPDEEAPPFNDDDIPF